MKQLLIYVNLLFVGLVLANSLNGQVISTTDQNLQGSDFGTEILVPVNATDIYSAYGNVLSVTVRVEYNPAVLSYVEVTNINPSIAPFVESINPAGNGVVQLNVVAPLVFPVVGFAVSDGLLFNIKFVFNGGLTPVTITEAEFLTTAFATVNASVVNGSVEGYTTLTGSNGSWNNASTWTGFLGNLTAPGLGHDVIIEEGGVVSIPVNGIANSILIEKGGQLTVETGASLSVTDNFLIESDPSGTGSFVNYGAPLSIPATVQQFMTGQIQWHLVSVPVNAVQSAEVFLNCYLQIWNETVGTWQDVQATPDPSSSVLLNVPMRGYSTAFHGAANTTLVFEGTLNDGAYSIGLTNAGPATYQGWNLVGNPYPSALDVDAAAGWTRTLVGNGVSFWNEANENYASYVDGVGANGGTQFIPAMQGFFVKASGAGSIGVSNAARVHSTQAFYKADPANTLRLVVQSGDFTDETVIRFMSEATVNYDEQFDMQKMIVENVPQLYTVTSASENMVINALPAIDEDTPIQLNLQAGLNGSMSINASGFETLEESTPVWLVDNVAGVQWNLSENPVYNFVANVNDPEDRFEIHFKNLTGIPGISDSGISIYSFNKNLYIDAGNGNKGEVVVLNVLGQEIMRARISENLNVIPVNLSNNVVVVKVISDQGISTRKVFIN